MQDEQVEFGNRRDGLDHLSQADQPTPEGRPRHVVGNQERPHGVSPSPRPLTLTSGSARARQDTLVRGGSLLPWVQTCGMRIVSALLVIQAVHTWRRGESANPFFWPGALEGTTNKRITTPGSVMGCRATHAPSLPQADGSVAQWHEETLTGDVGCYRATAPVRTGRGRSEMTPHLEENGSPLVVHVIPSPRGRGAQRAACALVDRLDEPGVARHRLLALFDGPPEVEIDLALEQRGGSRSAEGFDFRHALRLRRFLARLHVAAVVAHGGDAMKYALPAVAGTGCPLAYCVIGTYAGPPTWLHEWLWKRIMARADLVVAVGDEVFDECTGRFRVPPQRAVVIPNGRDPSQFHPRSEPADAAEGTLIFVGALTPQKRPERFIEVVRRLRADGHRVRAVMVGDGPLASTLSPMAVTHGVELMGSRSDVPELLRRSDLFLFTSLPTGEGMPGVLIEAGLSGLPVVATPVPGATTVLCDGRTGVIVDDSATAMAEAVADLLDDEDRRVAMGLAARTRCESKFNLDLMAQRWRTALRSVGDL